MLLKLAFPKPGCAVTRRTLKKTPISRPGGLGKELGSVCFVISRGKSLTAGGQKTSPSILDPKLIFVLMPPKRDSSDCGKHGKNTKPRNQSRAG